MTTISSGNAHLAMQRFKAISLFSGAMGLDIGLEQTGRFEVLAVVEVNPVFCETIRINRDAGRTARRDLRVYQADIGALSPRRLLEDLHLRPGELDLLVGGPPCQTFSTTGRRQTVQDHRGTMIWEFLRFVDVLKPRFFLMENVRGLVSAALKHRPIKDRPRQSGQSLRRDEVPGSVLRQFAEDLGAMSDAPYRLDAFEVNAVNYGAPQLRERLVCIGNRLGRVVEWPAPTHGHSSVAAKNSNRSHALVEPFRTLSHAIGKFRETCPEVLDFSPRKKRYLSMVPSGGNWRSLPANVQRESMGKAWHAKGGRSGWWRRLSYDLPCPTIVTMPNHASTSLCHPEEVRALSARECALVQEFPVDWEFVGTTQEKYTQIGNAVPTRLGKVAGEVIAACLDDISVGRAAAESIDHGRDLICSTNYRLVYVQSHVRTRKWYKGGRTYVWAQDADNSDTKYRPPVTERRERAI